MALVVQSTNNANMVIQAARDGTICGVYLARLWREQRSSNSPEEVPGRHHWQAGILVFKMVRRSHSKGCPARPVTCEDALKPESAVRQVRVGEGKGDTLIRDETQDQGCFM